MPARKKNDHAALPGQAKSAGIGERLDV